MWLIERIMALFAAAVLAVLAATVAALVLGWDAGGLQVWLEALRGQVVEGVVMAVLLAGGASYFAWVALRRPQAQAVRWQGDLGDVDVSLQAVEALVKQAATQVNGIRDLATSVSVTQEGLQVDLVVQLVPEKSIPDLASAVQEKVSRYIHEVVGVPVTSTRVSVRGIGIKEKPRVS